MHSYFGLAPLKTPLSIALAAILILGCQGTSAQDEVKKEASAKDESKKTEGHAKGKFTNRLAKETSPYLLMHAHNPVDWYPWGEEALAKAKKENKLIFLSVGYSSCHWCHVMERESFLDPEIAKFLNENFICVKVDREERPDVDSVYMTSLHVYNRLTRNGRGGGWPLSMFLTPDRKPFAGGTYFPARDGDRGAMIGFYSIVQKIDEIWTKTPAQIATDAELITRQTKLELDGIPPSLDRAIKKSWFTVAAAEYTSRFDPTYGGFGFSKTNPQKPKFPEPSNLMLLSKLAKQNPADTKAKDMLLKTLERMAMGGIHDHIGGGFHRYSVDRYWKIPHFEKMLYDNGQLASVYADAYELTGREDLKLVVDKMLHFVQTELTSKGGGFYSALDAESEGEEGKYYRWELKEIKEALTADEYSIFAKTYGLDQSPNFEKEYYAPQLSKPFATIAAELKLSPKDLEAKLVPMRLKLMKVRGKRERPLLDTKILTSWNGLMIRGFADAGRIFKNDSYIESASNAANFVLEKLKTKEGRLKRTYSDGQARLNAYLNDYSFLIDGLIALEKATGDKAWLAKADELQKKQMELFWDEQKGGFFFTSKDHEQLLVRSKNSVDGAQPSGNSVAAENLFYLGKALGNKNYSEKAIKTVESASAFLNRNPIISPRMMCAVSDILDGKKAEAPKK